MRAVIASLLAFASAVTAVGDALVVNNSLDPIYLWSVGDTTGEQVTVAPGAIWSEKLHRGTSVPGVAIKVTNEADGLYTGAATQILGYSLDGATVWYSLDATNGEPFAGQKLTVTGSGGSSIEWPTGNDPGDATRNSSSEGDIVFTIYQST